MAETEMGWLRIWTKVPFLFSGKIYNAAALRKYALLHKRNFSGFFTILEYSSAKKCTFLNIKYILWYSLENDIVFYKTVLIILLCK